MILDIQTWLSSSFCMCFKKLPLISLGTFDTHVITHRYEVEPDRLVNIYFRMTSCLGPKKQDICPKSTYVLLKGIHCTLSKRQFVKKSQNLSFQSQFSMSKESS